MNDVLDLNCGVCWSAQPPDQGCWSAALREVAQKDLKQLNKVFG